MGAITLLTKSPCQKFSAHLLETREDLIPAYQRPGCIDFGTDVASVPAEAL